MRALCLTIHFRPLAAQAMLVHEIAHEPAIKREVRKYFSQYAVISAKPTEAGTTGISEMHPFYVRSLFLILP